MNQIFATLFVLILSIPTSSAQGIFTKTFGGKQNEHAMSVIQTRNGDYVLAGFTFSHGKGKSDIWVIKLNQNGEKIWERYLGGKGFDWPNSIIETRDGNYVIAGYTKNNESNVSNAWVFQLNQHGEGMWSKIFGGNEEDAAKSVIQTYDGGFAVTGFTNSYSRGESDIWLLRLNAVGEEMWRKSYGGSGTEKGYSIIETKDSGFLIGGYQSYDSVNKADMLLVKTDRKGRGVWRKALKAQGNDIVESVIETPEGDFIAGGWAYIPEKNGLDAKLAKLSAGGRILWERNYGGFGKDAAYDLELAKNGGFIVAGQTGSFGSSSDLWIFHTDEEGRMRWQKRSKGDNSDYCHALALANDGGFILAGGTKSYSAEGSDMIIMKTDSRGNFGNGPVKIENISSSNTDPEVRTSPDIFKPNLYVLAIGISSYDDESIDLTYAHTDARTVSNKFLEQKGKLYNKVEMRRLENEEASLENIRRGISWLEREATQKDLILIFISSHGALDHKGNLYILPNDFDSNNLFATALNIRDLTEGINGTPCKKLILLDACHSGQSGFDLLQLASIKSLDLNRAVDDLVSKETGVTVMTSSSGKEFSYENPRWGHGAFSKAILEGLNGAANFNHDRTINLMELNLYVTERVKELTGGRQHPFTPINLFGDIPLFVLD